MLDLLEIDPARTVVITVDMQRRYLDMDIGTSPVAPEDAARVLASSKEMLDLARSRGVPVIHAYVRGRRAEAESGLLGSPALKLLWKNGFAELLPDRIEGSPQAEVPASLVAPDDVHVTAKKSMDAFLGTDLDTMLQGMYRPEAVVLAGINTDTCVYSTTFSASNRGYRPVVISDCVASMRGKESHRMALELMSSFAWILSLEQFRSKLGTGATTDTRRK
ncbi:MAG: cysteine hydrolase [Chloroflexota bacterium]|nr:cysteine hydrolase [Chloroflexota bacterium]